jgi:YD repeat-containing protein
MSSRFTRIVNWFGEGSLVEHSDNIGGKVHEIM